MIREVRTTRWMAICRCKCGNEVAVSVEHLRTGHTRSCGCAQRERGFSESVPKMSSSATGARSSAKKLLDICCKAGGASMGYHMAGFEVTGMDIDPQPHYPFEFWKADFTKLTAGELSAIAQDFDVVVGSPPCQHYSAMTELVKVTHQKKKGIYSGRDDYPDLVVPFREMVQSIGLPYIIENVPGAPLLNPVQLCGSSFALRVRRHRLFESSLPLRGVACNHQWQDRHRPYYQVKYGPGSDKMTGTIGVYGTGNGDHLDGIEQVNLHRVAMGIDWMDAKEIAQAIPPAYTFYLGKQILEVLAQ